MRPLKELDLIASHGTVNDSVKMYASPGGKYLLLSYALEASEQRLESFYKRNQSIQESAKAHLDQSAAFFEANAEMPKELVDLANLTAVRSWTQRGSVGPSEFADDRTAVVWNKDLSIGTQTPDGRQHLLCSAPGWSCVVGSFVSNNALFDNQVYRGIYGWAMELRLVDGRVIFREDLPQGQVPAGMARSTGKQRFAVAIDRCSGGSELLDIAGHCALHHIGVYDIPERQWICSIDAKKEKIKAISALALSPDGSLLALINQDGILEAFRLPAADSKDN